MTRDEGARLLAALHGNWPQVPIDDAVTMTWFSSAFERCDFQTGLAAVLRLVESEERFPTIARFNEQRRAIERRAAADSDVRHVLAPAADTTPRWLRVCRLIAVETPGWGTLERPKRGSERVHEQSTVDVRVAPGGSDADWYLRQAQGCGFCRERREVTDADLDARLAAAGVS